MILTQDFYNRNTLDVAEELLGTVLCHNINGKIIKGRIVETEAYTQDDPACHAYAGKTKRAITLFKKPGLSYVYLIYGMYHCMNIVTEAEDTAGAVLIRALEPVKNLNNSNGPGKLCREMQITKIHNELDVTCRKSILWVEKGETPNHIIKTTRIGIKKAADYPWRFYIKDNKWVSKI